MKNARQAEILNIIQNADVETQEQLLLYLKERGFNTTSRNPGRVNAGSIPAAYCIIHAVRSPNMM